MTARIFQESLDGWCATYQPPTWGYMWGVYGAASPEDAVDRLLAIISFCANKDTYVHARDQLQAELDANNKGA